MTSDRTDSSDAELQRPTNDEPAAWCAYWQALDQSWRTEPEIDEARKEALARRRAIASDPHRTEYPFRGMKLSRGDIEWLLETHDNGRGPVDRRADMVVEQYRQGLDLRGANLCKDLSHLPLDATHLEGAELYEAHLEGKKMAPHDLERLREQSKNFPEMLWSADLRGAFFDIRTDLFNI
jgi:hypothetical protein